MIGTNHRYLGSPLIGGDVGTATARSGKRTWRHPVIQGKRAECAAATKASTEFLAGFECALLESRRDVLKGHPTNVYFVFEVDGPAWKIGMALDPLARVSSIQNATRHELLLYSAAPATPALERFVLDYLRPHRIRGEWFHGHPHVLAVADAFLAAAQQCADMREDGKSTTDIEDTLAVLCWHAEEAALSLKKGAAA